jgi:hypothetical protein
MSFFSLKKEKSSEFVAGNQAEDFGQVFLPKNALEFYRCNVICIAVRKRVLLN